MTLHYLYVGSVAIGEPGVAGTGSNGYFLLFFAFTALAAAVVCWNSSKIGFITAIILPVVILLISAAQGSDFMFSEAVFGTTVNFLILFFALKTYIESFVYKVGLAS